MKYLRLGLIKSRIFNTECKRSQDPGMAVGIKHDTGFKQTNKKPLCSVCLLGLKIIEVLDCVGLFVPKNRKYFQRCVVQDQKFNPEIPIQKNIQIMPL